MTFGGPGRQARMEWWIDPPERVRLSRAAHIKLQGWRFEICPRCASKDYVRYTPRTLCRDCGYCRHVELAGAQDLFKIRFHAEHERERRKRFLALRVWSWLLMSAWFAITLDLYYVAWVAWSFRTAYVPLAVAALAGSGAGWLIGMRVWRVHCRLWTMHLLGDD